MNERIETARETGPVRTTRRETLGQLGGGAALAALAAAMSGKRVLATQATPAAGAMPAGAYTTLRIRKVKPDHSGDELNALVETGFVPQVTALPGFISYVALWNAETRDWVSISTFTDQAAADESTEVAAAFGTASGSRDYVDGDPIVVEGAVVIAVGQDG
jgi:hypothetical protein